MSKLTNTLLAAGLLVASLLAGRLLLPAPAAALAKAPTATPAPSLTPPGFTAETGEAATRASSPEEPLAYGNEWIDIQAGEWHWYAFKYDFDNSGDSRQTPASIRLDAKPGEGATLLLLNGDQVRAWEHGEKLQGFGAATPVINSTRVRVDLDEFCDQNPDDPICDDQSDRADSQCENLRDPLSTDGTCNFTLNEPRGYATWTGTIGASGTYYILVRGNTRLANRIEYKLAVSGDGLNMK
jgi:hypothetical protein